MRQLNEFEHHIIVEKGTEPPFSGAYNDFFEHGIYVCKRCDVPLFESDSKFRGHCGWASFDYALQDVQEQPDKDGRRTEIVCANCGGHLGHVFFGEGFTPKNVRHCVNSASILFVPQSKNK